MSKEKLPIQLLKYEVGTSDHEDGKTVMTLNEQGEVTYSNQSPEGLKQGTLYLSPEEASENWNAIVGTDPCGLASTIKEALPGDEVVAIELHSESGTCRVEVWYSERYSNPQFGKLVETLESIEAQLKSKQSAN